MIKNNNMKSWQKAPSTPKKWDLRIITVIQSNINTITILKWMDMSNSSIIKVVAWLLRRHIMHRWLEQQVDRSTISMGNRRRCMITNNLRCSISRIRLIINMIRWLSLGLDSFLWIILCIKMGACRRSRHLLRRSAPILMIRMRGLPSAMRKAMVWLLARRLASHRKQANVLQLQVPKLIPHQRPESPWKTKRRPRNVPRKAHRPPKLRELQ